MNYCRCEGWGHGPCGRVYAGRLGWIRQDDPHSDLPGGLCPACLRLREKKFAAARWRAEQKALEVRAQCFGPAPEGTDPFEGL